ncbi:hypothetical protein DH2020_010941 [Rehmannia glutinosa]|uniref:RING-type domain-containing protein n=1 Tax=Rehmannia glutinosa TaxID=99300 RepID=A0ABR0XBZ9_REHGL
MPISDPEVHRHLHHHAPPQYLTRGQRKLLLFFLKCIIMVAVISLFFFFLGFVAIVLLCFVFLSNTVSRRCTRLLRPNNAADGLPSLQALIPVVGYSSAAFPAISDCPICLDYFQEGDECRNLPVCKHFFHAKCLDRWIGKKPTCPVCRTRVDLDPGGLPGSRIGGDDRWKRLWVVDFEGETSY